MKGVFAEMMPTVNQDLAHLTAVSIMKLPLEIIGKPSFWKSPHADEGIGTAAPGIAVGDLFEEVGLFVEGFAADLDVHGEVCADVEGGIDVDEFEAARVLDLTAQGPAFEGGEDELVIAPNEFVGPALDLAASHIKV